MPVWGCKGLSILDSFRKQNTQLQLGHSTAANLGDVCNGHFLGSATEIQYLSYIPLCASVCLINILKQVW